MAKNKKVRIGRFVGEIDALLVAFLMHHHELQDDNPDLYKTKRTREEWWDLLNNFVALNGKDVLKLYRKEHKNG